MPKLREHVVPRILEMLRDEVRCGAQPLGGNAARPLPNPEDLDMESMQTSFFVKHDRMYHHKKVSLSGLTVSGTSH